MTVGLLCAAASSGWVAAAQAEVDSGAGSGEAGALSGSLIVPGSPVEGEQLQAQEQAKLANPEAVWVREESRTKFAGLNAEQAMKVAGEAFPAVIDESAARPPPLPAGQRITGYLDDDAASVEVGGGGQAVLESMAPIAAQTASGQRTPIDLTLSGSGGSFVPATAAVAVSIPKRSGDGVQLPGVGVSLTAVDGSGAPLGGAEGVVDGATVVYANAQTDMDSLVKPTPDGFAADTLLRSAASPQRLFFRVGLPAGASLVEAKDGSGLVDVVKEGRVLVAVLPPSARDAAGTEVPVGMSVSGSMLVLSVEDRSAEYQYPIEVDPTFIEERFTPSGSKRSNWQWESSNSARFASNPTDNKATKELSEASPAFLETYGTAAYAESEKAYWAYQTQGDSKIYEFNAETEAKNSEDHIESFLELEAKGTSAQESKELLSTEAEKTAEYARKAAAPICPKNSKGEQECLSTAGGEGNAVRFQQSVVNKPTSKYAFSDFLYKGEVLISEPAGTHSTASYNKSASTLEIEVENSKKEKEKQTRENVLYGGAGRWLSEYDGAAEFIAEDPGIGVSATKLEYESAPGAWEQLMEHNYLSEGACTGVQCSPKHTELWTLNKRLPNGEDKIRYRGEDAMGAATHETESLATEGTATVKVDDVKPHGLFLSGLPYGNELSEKTYTLTAYASDGEGSTIPSSGIASLKVTVDGELLKPEAEGKCTIPKGECTATAKYKLEGVKLGAGHHAIVIIAKDKAGNEAREEETLSIRHSTPVPVGPGAVDLQSGDFTLNPSDVSLGSGLSVSRAYSSRGLSVGAEGPLGPQWLLSLGSEETLSELIDHSVLVTSGTGGQTIFAAILNSKSEPTGKYESPPGDSNLDLTLEENEKHEKIAYYLKDPAANTSTKFAPSSAAKVWLPAAQEGPVSTSTVTYLYQTVEVAGKKVTRPNEEIAAHPKVSCEAAKEEIGCRTLKFTYATTTTAVAEYPGGWGEYEGRLAKVSYEGYNPATKKLTETPIPVAEYSYDAQGKLRAEWDPRISPALKTTYGYDAEGHVTAVNPPGQEPWILQYAATTTDPGTGRLMAVTRPAPTTAIGEGNLPASSGVPKPTGTAIEGETLTAQTGTWTGKPLTYSYQWEKCGASKLGCHPIPGATNQTYQLPDVYVGQELKVKVTATNSNGSVSASSVETELVKGIVPTYVTEFGKGTLDAKYESRTAHYGGAVSAAVDASGNVWALSTHGKTKEEESTKIYEFTATGTLLHSYSLANVVGTGIAINQKTGEVYVGDAKNNELWMLSASGTVLGSKTLRSPEFTEYSYQGNWVSVAVDANGNVWAATYNASTIEEFSENGTYITAMTAGQRSYEIGPTGLAVTNGYVYATLFVPSDGETKYAKLNYAGELEAEKQMPAKAGAYAFGFEPAHNYFYTAKSEAKPVQEWLLGPENPEPPFPEITSFGETNLTDAVAIAASPSTHNLYIVDNGTGEIEKWTAPNPEYKAPPPPSTGTNAQTTIEYNVPVTGSEAPNNMSPAEVAKWGQKPEEAPEEATAILPPDSPQGWPATSYKRASIYYLDSQGRLVNTATPTTGKYGDIATTEYNETNDAVRTLSPDNRATALAAGAKSEEVASLLSTFNTYRSKCASESEFAEERESTEPGTRLCETEGPAHSVKYVAGKEQKEVQYARAHAMFYYDQKVPAEGPNKESFANTTFNLLTKTLNLVKVVNSKGEKLEEVEPKITVTSYAGQSNLGWKLREPTSVTVDPEGAKITHTTTYYEEGHEAMGQVMETRGPEGASGNSAHDQKLIYYSAEENKEYALCGAHPAWAGLVCETIPAHQPPETAGVPHLPETTTIYNIWDEPETIEQKFPKTTTVSEETRTTKNEYDSAGRMTASEQTSTATTGTADKALPKVTNAYNTATGALAKQSTTVGEKTKAIESTYNKVGQLERYVDADGNVAKYIYGGPANDGLLEEMSADTTQKYTYSATTKQLTKLVDSSAGTFTASYDTEGKLVEEGYPNGMCASYLYNADGEATHLEYTKAANCNPGEGAWFSETQAPSAHGETMSRASTLATEEYAYDTLGRLTEARETPTGEYCKTRTYHYDEESNRTEALSREPNSKHECATEGGTSEKHTYDEANRLTDTGITYDPLGNVTKLPSADAEGHALESTFYVDNAVATQTQNGVTNNYYLDPEGRVRETVTGAKKVINHYNAGGQAIAWSCEGTETAETCEAGGKWTRDIPGIDGTLTASQQGGSAGGETPILQLHDLQGNVVATIRDKTGETKLESTYNSTEFGVPNGGKEPPKLAWLGAGGIERSLASGVITEGATSYVPQIDRALQTEEVAPPGLPEGSGAGPAYILQEEPWVLQGATREANEAPGLEAEREREAEAAACRANLLACPVEVEDPHWIWTFTIAQAEQLAGLFEAGKALSFISIGDDIKTVLGVDFTAKIEAKVEQAIAGVDQSELEDWAYNIGAGLSICGYDAAIKLGHPHNPHCWVYVPTNNYHVGIHTPLGFVGAVFELPAFKKDAQVAYCLKGVTYCYEV